MELATTAAREVTTRSLLLRDQAVEPWRLRTVYDWNLLLKRDGRVVSCDTPVVLLAAGISKA